MSSSQFQNINLSGVTFSNCRLSGATFGGVPLEIVAAYRKSQIA
ncbi:pentapeptide repeat-containing protein [Agrobacterium rosae]|nr:pentapeptide repeat-containing protein [Agrobacterium rosae]MBN7806648.1 pentapeptide repeat-containing protein [Agrobacterium rosae]